MSEDPRDPSEEHPEGPEDPSQDEDRGDDETPFDAHLLDRLIESDTDED